MAEWRISNQRLLPAEPGDAASPGEYELHPTFPLAQGELARGWAALAALLARGAGMETPAGHAASAGDGPVGTRALATVDGYGGVMWDELRRGLTAQFDCAGLTVAWFDVRAAMLPAGRLEELLAPFLGGDDPIFGKRFDGSLADLFDPAALAALEPDPEAQLSIVYGPGAALAGWEGALAYAMVPKNEIQYRSRAGSVAPLGTPSRGARVDYKRMFFVDWPALDAHLRALTPHVDLFVDAQRPCDPVIGTGAAVRATLAHMAASPFRARPWFERGPWGGTWLREHIGSLPRQEPDYAWSFELITPENGLILADDRLQLEVPFDLLMFHAGAAVLGEPADRFGPYFPIRFNYLDTWGGGNLSLQVHPSDPYIRGRFGQGFTQDECYYVLDTRADARDPATDQPVIYLGFRDGVDPAAFRAALERCQATGEALDTDRWIGSVPAERHGLYLIPNGTVHSSGEGSLVLEISATTYLFTFKMYDWQRLDLDGRPRPINLERAFENLDFSRTPDVIAARHIARPAELESGPGWRVVHLPTHEQHFYDVHRLEFDERIEVPDDGTCHVLGVVEGDAVTVESANGGRFTFSHAETFVLPAAAGGYTLMNEGRGRAMVVKAFVKPGRGEWRTVAQEGGGT